MQEQEQQLVLQQPTPKADGCDPTTGQYRGRFAPSPTGLLHVGHAKTFWTAFQRAQEAKQKGSVATMVMRIDDIDGHRCKQVYVDSSLEDCHWLGLDWQEGVDVGGKLGPYVQSQRMHLYKAAFESLKAKGLVYRCCCTRKDIAAALSAPHQGEEEAVYPGTCRPNDMTNAKQCRPLDVALLADQQSSLCSVLVTKDEVVQKQTAHIPLEMVSPTVLSMLPTQTHEAITTDYGTASQQCLEDPVTQQSVQSPVKQQSIPSGLTQSVLPNSESHTDGQQGGNAVTDGTTDLDVTKAVHQPLSSRQGLTSSEARQQLKAARKAERAAKQAEARHARQTKQRSAHNSPRGSIDGHLTNTQLSGLNWSWRFRVPEGSIVRFTDNNLGLQEYVCGKDIGDFVVWRHDGSPSYQLACAVDDATMEISEVVRGADLLMSTARQLLLAQALGVHSPVYYHCPLIVDPVTNIRLAKRHDALSLRTLRQQGATPQDVISGGAVSLVQKWDVVKQDLKCV